MFETVWSGVGVTFSAEGGTSAGAGRPNRDVTRTTEYLNVANQPMAATDYPYQDESIGIVDSSLSRRAIIVVAAHRGC